MKYELIGGPWGGEWIETYGRPHIRLPRVYDVQVSSYSPEKDKLPSLGYSVEEVFYERSGAAYYYRPKEIKRDDGLTKTEGDVMDALVKAANTYGQLPVQHPSEREEFAWAIHRLQDMLALRVARRTYPKGWPTKS